jgi:hypothetical protein
MTAAFVSLYNHGSSAYEGDDYSIDRGNGKGYPPEKPAAAPLAHTLQPAVNVAPPV